MPATEAMPNVARICLQMTGETLSERRDDAVKFIAAEIEGSSRPRSKACAMP
jgi:hypothetical protein